LLSIITKILCVEVIGKEIKRNSIGKEKERMKKEIVKKNEKRNKKEPKRDNKRRNRKTHGTKQHITTHYTKLTSILSSS